LEFFSVFTRKYLLNLESLGENFYYKIKECSRLIKDGMKPPILDSFGRSMRAISNIAKTSSSFSSLFGGKRGTKNLCYESLFAAFLFFSLILHNLFSGLSHIHDKNVWEVNALVTEEFTIVSPNFSRVFLKLLLLVYP